MDSTKTRARLPLALLMACTLAACSVAGPRSSPLPHEGATMIDIYKKHLQEEMVGPGSARERLPARAADEDDEPPALRRTTLDPTINRFQRLPNPDLEMHVYPHLANGKYPVPGYVTVFPMYETVQYAMPGEVAPRRNFSRTASQSTVSASSTTAHERADTLDPMFVLERVSPTWHQVAVDFRVDYGKLCGGSLSDRDLIQLLSATSRDKNVHDLDDRYSAFARVANGPAYQAQRAKLACQDIAKAMADQRIASQ
jgi:conjugative transfer region lipoprotein (TIGR03751 family)